MDVTVDKNEYDIMFTYSLVGLAVSGCQGIETLLILCMGMIFEDSNGQTLEDLTNPKTQKRTIGQFFDKIKKKMDIDPKFEELFQLFLEHRNTLVHDLTKDGGRNFHTADGRKNIENFLQMLIDLNDTMTKILTGVVMRWTEPEKYADLSRVKTRHKLGTLLGDAEQIFAPHSPTLIKKKSNKSEQATPRRPSD